LEFIEKAKNGVLSNDSVAIIHLCWVCQQGHLILQVDLIEISGLSCLGLLHSILFIGKGRFIHTGNHDQQHQHLL